MVAGGPSGNQLVTNDQTRQENIRDSVLMSNPLSLSGLLIASLEIWYHFSTSLTWVNNTNDEIQACEIYIFSINIILLQATYVVYLWLCVVCIKYSKD